MPEIKRKAMRRIEYSKFTPKPFGDYLKDSRVILLPLSILGLTVLLFIAPGCAPQKSSNSGEGNSAASASQIPELTDETIRERINDAGVWEVPEETGSGEPISWRFQDNEPKEITVVDKQIDGDRATIVLDIKTSSAPNARSPRALAGQIRTEWELKTGWVLRRWEIVRTENISMKYKLLPKPSPQNANR